MIKLYLLRFYNWINDIVNSPRKTMPLKMIYDVDTSRNCLFPSAAWRREMDNQWLPMDTSGKHTYCCYNFRKLVKKNIDCVVNVRFEQEYIYNNVPYSIVSRSLDDAENIVGTEGGADIRSPIIIQKVLAVKGKKTWWDMHRLLRYAGPLNDFHDCKGIRMRDLFESEEDTPDEWRIYTLMGGEEPIVIKKNDLLSRESLVQGKSGVPQGK